MQLLSQLNISRPGQNARIQLLQGDLSAIPREHATDILVLSAFPGNYSPTTGTLIGALFEKGLSVKQLAENKESDLREQLNCWLSPPLDPGEQERFNVKRILCFEPGLEINASQDVVGNIFRCINTFAFDEKNNVVAVPMVAAGCQRAKMEAMLPALLDAAVFWLENGLPLECIKLVIYHPEKIPLAVGMFDIYRRRYEQEKAMDMSSCASGDELNLDELPETSPVSTIELTDRDMVRETAPAPAHAPAPAGAPQPPVEPSAPDRYDYFISYAHTHSDLVNSFVQQIKQKKNGVQIFYDRESIPPGGLWIRQLSSAIQKANKVLIFLSPDYDRSPVCWDEFQCAKLMEYNKRKSIIQTIYLYDYKELEMPPIMGIYSYIDCREGDQTKLAASIERILENMS